MANYRVVVELTARFEYEVEIEVEGNANYREAEEAAINLWREKMPVDFQVEKGYITQWEAEAEQKSWQCAECGVEIDSDLYDYKDQMCESCSATADRTLTSARRGTDHSHE